MIQFMGRVFEASQTADYPMLLEDDVHVMKPVTLSTLHHDINRVDKFFFFPEESLKTIGNQSGRQEVRFGGCIFRCSFFRDLERNPEWENWVYQVADAVEGSGDELFTALMLVWGGTLADYPGLMAPKWENFDGRMRDRSIEVIHRLKKLYD
jgi:hypothetical protein